MSSKISSKFRNGPVILVSQEVEYTFPLSYAYLAGYLREMGEDVWLLFRPPLSQFDELVKQIMDMNPLLVGFGNLYPELAEVKKLIQMLNEADRQFPIVIGGQMVTPTPEFAVEITGADFGVIGEGEITLHRLVMALRAGEDPATVKGLVVRLGNDYAFTGPGEFIKDLSKLPRIPYDLFPINKWLNIGQWYARRSPQPHWRFTDRVINVHGGRGCPFSCNFCYHHSKPRYRPMDVAIAEAAEALERFDGNVLYFSDETTLISPKKVQEMLKELRKLNRRIEYSVSSRFDILDRIDDDLLLEMKETGCRIMGLGIESGSDRILDIIGKKYSVETIWRGLERLKKAGILPTVSIMVGQYTETVEEVEASIALMRESVRSNRNIQYAFTITTPFPGSQLYDLIFQEGYLRDDKEFYDLYFQSKGVFKYVVNLSDMSDEVLMTMYHKIWNTYKKEKLKAVKPGVMIVEYSMRGVGTVYERLNRKVFSKLRKSSMLNRIGFTGVLDKLNWLYEFVQIRLDHLRLKLRGIPAR
jgi:anaerobic magnesium-protoporphyrin IX monomethyl ester cyclase